MTAAVPAPPLLFITDRLSTAADLPDVARAALQAGCRWIMVREKDLDTDALTTLAADIVALARPFGARVVINGNVDVAAAVGAAGVHTQSVDGLDTARARLGAAALIGVSTHSIAEAEDAASAGADYVTISPVFLTGSKPGYGPALGVLGLAAACSSVTCPVIALAGVSPANAASCLKAGAAGVAVMGGIMRAANPGIAVCDLLHALGAVSDRSGRA